MFWFTLLFTVVFLYKKVVRPSAKLSHYVFPLSLFLIGCSTDWLMLKAGLIKFDLTNQTLPLWLVVLWGWFSVTFLSLYSWLQQREAIAGLLGMIFGPLSYWGATVLAPVEIIQPLYFSLSSSLFWGLLFAASVYVARNYALFQQLNGQPAQN